jgi:hypothetical protein
MALFRDLGVGLPMCRTNVSLCDVQEYVSAETLARLDLAKNDSFRPRERRRLHPKMAILERPDARCLMPPGSKRSFGTGTN